MIIRLATAAIGLLVASCGGGSSGESGSLAPPPATVTAQSPGGIWLALDSNAGPVQFFISETGTVRSIFDVEAVTDGATFGAGSVAITGTDEVNGVLQAKGIQSAGGPPPVDLSCALSGTVRERLSLQLDVVCSDNKGIVYDESYELRPEPAYFAGSSLVDIAGNYTLPSSPGTNTLSITADGTLFGIYHNGANCTVNGSVSLIDPAFSFLDVEWTMANCTDPFGIYGGATLSGFAMESPDPNDPPGSYYFLLTGVNDLGFFSISVTFERT